MSTWLNKNKTILAWVFMAGVAFAALTQLRAMAQDLSARIMQIEKDVAQIDRMGTYGSQQLMKVEHELLAKQERRIELLEQNNGALKDLVQETRTDVRLILQRLEGGAK